MYIVTRFLIDGEGKETHSQQRYDDEVQAIKRFYSIYVSDIDNVNVQYELIQMIEMNSGYTKLNQVLDNRVSQEA